jgi:hypothetical protein
MRHSTATTWQPTSAGSGSSTRRSCWRCSASPTVTRSPKPPPELRATAPRWRCCDSSAAWATRSTWRWCAR